jgi:RNA polymerase sigma-B factor
MQAQVSDSTEELWSYHRLVCSGKTPEAQLRRLRDAIVEKHRGLCRKEAHHWKGLCSEPYEDLEQEACLGLIKAVERFDPTEGNAFSSFAMPYIRGEIQHYLRDKGWGPLRPPRRVVEEFASIQRDQRKAAKHGRQMELDEIAQLRGISSHRWEQMVQMRTRKPILSLDETLQIAMDDYSEETLEAENRRKWIYQQLECLPTMQRTCIQELFWADLTVEQIARRHGVGTPLVRLWIHQAIDQLKANAREQA